MTSADPLADIPDDELRPQAPVRALQHFSDDYLHRGRRLSPQDIARFLEEFRLNVAAAEASRQSRPRTLET